MRRIEEANKFELARSIKALVARAALCDQVSSGQFSLERACDSSIPRLDGAFCGVGCTERGRTDSADGRM